MKHILIFILFLIISCQPIINEYYYESGEVKKFVNLQVYPNDDVTKAYSPNTPAGDWALGILYKENARSFDGLTHIINLTPITGGNQALVYLEAEVVDHGYDYFNDQYDTEAGAIYIRGFNNNVEWQSVTPRFNEYAQGVLVITDATGKLEWYSEHNSEYWANPTAEPGNEIYKWEKITITAKWLVTGVVVP